MQSRQLRILCTEDHADTRELISLLLIAQGFEVICAGNGQLALSLAQTEQFDLYLLDNWMPGLSGAGLCEKLREFDPETPILFYSAAAYEADKEHALSCGAQGYLSKPVDNNVLISEVQELIAASKRMPGQCE